jgi:hypothetical protein
MAETAWLAMTRIVCVLPLRPPSAILVRAARRASAVRCGEDVLRGSLRGWAASWVEGHMQCRHLGILAIRNI